MRAAVSLRLVSLGLLLLSHSVSAPAQERASTHDAGDLVLAETRAAFERGGFERGIELLRAALADGLPGRRVEATILLSQGYEAVGRNGDSIRILEEALGRAGADPQARIYLQARLAAAHRLAGQAEKARTLLDLALKSAATPDNPGLHATLVNELGALQAATEDVQSAIGSFAASARLAREAGLRELELAAMINEAGARIQYGESGGFEELLDRSLRNAAAMPDSHPKALYLLSLGVQCRLAQQSFGLDAGWRRRAYDACHAGLASARAIGSRRLTSQAYGFIGRLYEDEHRYEEALRYARVALLEAERSDAPDLLYLWQWQVARTLRAQGETEQAIAGYRRAIRTLEGIRSSLARSPVPFQAAVGPVFLELADLLLRRAGEGGRAGQGDLAEVLATVEKLNQAEVAEYFRDDCVVQTQDSTQLDKLAPDAAVVYPVLLPDRIELILSLRGSLMRFAAPVGREELTALVREFRQNIERYDPRNGFMRQARRLHALLIDPLEKHLLDARVTTLVFVPEGPLRTIPFAAMHDGTTFLIERYAVVTTPGLTLTSSSPLPRNNVQTLAAGLSEAVQGFNPLPSVKSELAGIEAQFPTVRLQDRSFMTSSVEGAMSRGGYSVVHLATHGYFDSDHSKSFLLTFDGKITMDALQATIGRRKYSDEPLELLVLSACETASGDDRAALGLAGAGLRAGSRSVVATLWPISDESTAALISDFYRRLKDPGSSKAQALREAQRQLLRQERLRHPFFWAPFLLIGNWL